MRRKKLGRVASILWRLKGTILIQAVIITLGWLTRNQSQAEHQQLMNRFGMDYDFLREGRLWPLLTGTWFQSTPGITVSMVVLVFWGTAVFEYLSGTVKVLVTVISADWIATILTDLTLRVWSGLGSAKATALLATPDSGTSALAHAGLAVAALLLPPRWRVAALSALVISTVAQIFYEPPAALIAHGWAVVYGILVGWFMLRHRLNSSSEAGAARVAHWD